MNYVHTNIVQSPFLAGKHDIVQDESLEVPDDSDVWGDVSKAKESQHGINYSALK